MSHIICLGLFVGLILMVFLGAFEYSRRLRIASKRVSAKLGELQSAQAKKPRVLQAAANDCMMKMMVPTKDCYGLWSFSFGRHLNFRRSDCSWSLATPFMDC